MDQQTAAPGQPAAPRPKPGAVQAIAVVTLVSGILNVIIGVTVIPLTLFIWTLPGAFSIVVGIMEIAYAAKLLPDPIKPTKPNRAVAIMEIVNVINGSITSLAAGIVALVFYSNKDVTDYFAERSSAAR
jgi:peptidoglycan/LPS O-acetylase OafA/YrhL